MVHSSTMRFAWLLSLLLFSTLGIYGQLNFRDVQVDVQQDVLSYPNFVTQPGLAKVFASGGETLLVAGGIGGGTNSPPYATSSVSYYNQPTTDWVALPPLSLARIYSTVACYQSTCMVCGGTTFNGYYLSGRWVNNCDSYNINSQQMITTYMPVSQFSNPKSVVCQNSMMVFSSNSTTVMLFNFSTNIWRSSTLPSNSRPSSGVCVDGSIILSGSNASLFNLTTSSWLSIALPYNGPTLQISTAAVGRKVYFGGGQEANTGKIIPTVICFDLSTSSITVLPSLLVPTYNAIGASIGSIVIFVGGYGGKVIQLIDTTNNMVYQTGSILDSFDHTGAVVGNRLYFGDPSYTVTITDNDYCNVLYSRNVLSGEIILPYSAVKGTFDMIRNVTRKFVCRGRPISVSPFIDGIRSINQLNISSTEALFVNIRADNQSYQWYIPNGIRNNTLVDYIPWSGNCTLFPCYLTVKSVNGLARYIAADTASGILLGLTECGDGTCDNTEENCITCPSDCSCMTDEWRAEVWADTSFRSVPLSAQTIQSIDLSIVPSSQQSYSISWQARIQPEESGIIKLRLTILNGGVRMSLSPAPMTNRWYGNNNIDMRSPVVWDIDGWNFKRGLKTQKSFKVTGGMYYNMLVQFFSTVPASQSAITLEIYDEKKQGWSSEVPISYSLGACSDAFMDIPFEKACQTSAFCGDGVCSSYENITSCLSDCLDSIPVTSQCTTNIASDNPRPLKGGMPLSDDTLGELINNQAYYTLPGMEHLLHGVDAVTGLEGTSPIFRFTFCDKTRTIQDSYRNRVYHIPDQLSASPYPTCSYNSEENSFSSSHSYATSLDTRYGYSASASIGGSIAGITASAETSMMRERSVHEASSLETERSGRVISVESKCLTSKVELSTIALNREFASALLDMGSDVEKCTKVVAKYGTHYYRMASLGGTLRQMFTMTEESYFSQSERQTSQSARRSFSGSVSYASLYARASYEEESEESTSVSQSDKFKSQTIKSNVITYGGAPGSFSPGSEDAQSAPSTWAGWAETIDLLPVPVDYSVEFLLNIIPDASKKCWLQGYNEHMNVPSLQRSKHMMSITTDCKPGSTQFGPFSFQFIGDRYAPSQWIPFTAGNIHTLSYDSPMMFPCNSIVEIQVLLPSVGNIKQLLISNISAAVPQQSSPIPSDWPVQSIRLTDMTTSAEYLFLKPTTNTTDNRVWKSSVATVSDGVMITINTDPFYMFLPSLNNTYHEIQGDLAVSIIIYGTNGTTSRIVTQRDCVTHNCWFNSPIATFYIDSDGALGDIQNVKMSIPNLKVPFTTTSTNRTVPFIVVDNIKVTQTKNKKTKSWHNSAPFILSSSGEGLKNATEICLPYYLNSTRKDEMLKSLPVLEALCENRTPSSCQLRIDEIKNQLAIKSDMVACSVERNTDCVYESDQRVNPNMYEACMSIPSSQRIITLVTL